MKKIFTLIISLLATLSVSAQDIDLSFTSFSSADQALVQADATNWYHETGSNNRWHHITAMTSEALTANGTELDYAKGLLFTVSKGSETSGNLRIDIKSKRMWVGGATKIIIPNVAEGKQIYVSAKTSAGSSTAENERARSVNISSNVTPTSGSFNVASDAAVDNYGIVNAAGDVTISFSGAMYIYAITVGEAGDEEGGSDIPVVPSITDNAYSVSSNLMANQVLVNANNNTKYYNAADVTSIDIEGNQVKVSQGNNVDAYSGTVSEISFRKAAEGDKATVENAEGKVNITESKGWFESAYVKFNKFDGASKYNVYIKGGKHADFTKIDEQLVREYKTYIRADVLGLVAGEGYEIKVVPVDEAGTELTSAANSASGIKVSAYDRGGFAHKGATEGVGAYNNDGSLKANAIVIYLTKNNAKTVSADIKSSSSGTTKYTGIQQIIYGYQKGVETRPLDVRIIGTIDAADCDAFGSSEEGLQIKGKNSYSKMNITIEGVGEDAVTRGFGFLLRNAGYVEMRNFANMLCSDDGISIDTDNEHIWIHNIDMFYGQAGGDADQAKGDGTIDLKGDSRYITISYVHFWDSGKSSLCGMKSETGPNWITYHHNWFDHSDSRHPRIRTMSVHVYNNYYDGNSKYGVGAAFKSNAFVENNYFRGNKCPMLISQQGSDISSDPDGTFSGEDGGMIKSFGNVMVENTKYFKYVTYQQNPTQFDAYEASSRDEKVPANVVALKGGRGYDNFDTDASIMYEYEVDDANDVPNIVTGWLGAGRMNHGDFKWTIFKSLDTDYNVDNALKSALSSYKNTELIGIMGDENASSGESGSGETGGGEGGETGGGEGGETGGGGEQGTVIAADVECSFDGGTASNPLFTATGSKGDSKGANAVTYNGNTYTSGLKLNSGGTVKFTTTETMNMTLILSKAKANAVKVDGTNMTGTEVENYYLVTVNNLQAGEHTIAKGASEGLLIYIGLTKVE